jgi:acyl-coenzyme A thioesterase PaaI-like protein
MSEWNEDLVEKVGWNAPDELPPGPRRERRRLADALRKLADDCMTTDAPEDVLRAAADGAEAIVGSLEKFPRRSSLQALRDGDSEMDPSRFAERLALIGKSNPFAPPMKLVPEGEVSIGLVTFEAVYGGAPGWVHGGMIAAAIDQVYGYAQLRRGESSVTSSLTVRYLRPTPLSKPLRIEARFISTNGRETQLSAQVFDGDRLLIESEATFVAVKPAEFMAKLLRK